jgi:DNA uptake protein ComE-like DNA-binding protein
MMIRAAEQPDLLDINVATADQLKTLPGIEMPYAEKIIKGRPWPGRDELVQRKFFHERPTSKSSTRSSQNRGEF